MDTVGSEILYALKAAGARAVFGIPGDYVLPFFSVMEKTRILPLYTLGHEPSVGFAADGAARHGGGVGVAVVTYGAGAMNMINAVACAWAERSPLVVISGAPADAEMEQGLMLHHQIRTPMTQMNVFREFTCDQARLDDPAELHDVLKRVIGNCLAQSRPVYLELPRDMAARACGHKDIVFKHDLNRNGHDIEACIAHIIDCLKNAKNPAILAGSQVRRYGLEESTFALAQKWGVPLLNTFMGKGLFAGKKEPYMGTYLGLAGEESPRKIVEESDITLLTGMILCDTNLGVSGKRMDETRVIFITPEETVVCGRSYEGVGLEDVIPALLKVDLTVKYPVPHVPLAKEKTVLNKSEAIKPDDVLTVVQDFIDRQETKFPVVCDVGDCLFVGMGLEGVPLLASGYYATMGFSVPAAMGVQAATGERPLVIVGDGGFQMTGFELINATRLGLDPIVVLMNNASWEMLGKFDPGAGYTRLAKVDYATMMQAGNCNGVQVKTPAELQGALDLAFKARGKPCVIDVILPPGMSTSMMQRYISAIKSNMLKAGS